VDSTDSILSSKIDERSAGGNSAMRIRLVFVLPLIVVALLGCGIIQRFGEPRYYALSISSDQPISVSNLNRYDWFFGAGSESVSPIAIMAEAGDLLRISVEDSVWFYYRYDPRDGQQLSFTITVDSDDPLKAHLNGRLISLGIYDNPGVWKWIEECDLHSLQHLRSVHFFFFEDKQASLDLNLVQKIADARPNIGLFLGDIYYDPVEIQSEIITLFKPSWLITCGPLDFNEAAISRLSKLECLYVLEPGHTRFIEELPKLETLILHTDDDAEDIQFDKLRNLRSLTLIESIDINNLETFNNKNRLRNLFLIGCEVDDISPIRALAYLTGLGFFYCEGAIDLSELQNLSRLRWFSFPPDVNQSEFSRFLSQHPKLEVVDLLGCEEIDDLSPLAQLTEIQGLTLDVVVGDLSPLYQLTDLEVLILDEDSVDEDEYEDLQASLPDTQIVINSGGCLGSGWILLMIPVTAAASLIIRLVRRKS
jgi:hypothetical protein